MKAVTWHGTQDVRVDNVSDPEIQESTDAIVRITTTAICGSDLHLYNVLGPFMDEGDIIGHEPMGIVEETGGDVSHIRPGDRVVVPFNISCGHCYMCEHGWQSQCEITQVRERGNGAALLGYSRLYGSVPGGQAEYLRVPQAHYGPIKVPEEPPDERFIYLADVLPTAWQAVAYAEIPFGGSVAIFGLGPIGQMSARIARHKGHRVFAVDSVPKRLEMARRYGAETVDLSTTDDVPEAIRELTDGRGPDSVIDAVGMEAHGSPSGKFADNFAGLLPEEAAKPLAEKANVDNMSALLMSLYTVRRAGTVSLSGVYGGQADPLPMIDLFDKGIQIRMGQANVKRWIPDILPLLTGEGDPLGVEDFASHRWSLEAAPRAYDLFDKKQDGAFKMLLKP
jgi:threonine dehydrogenase-like Zn-dependent dehydrogenase